MSIFANMLPADKEMEALITKIRAPYEAKLNEVLAVTEGTRAGRFETVDDRGNLVLRLPNGATETIAAGDVLLGH